SATGADAARRGGLIVYQEDRFGGDSRVISDDAANLDWIHFDDRISSVEVKRGTWELCEHAHFRGRCITVDHDIRRLDRLGFDDKTSSIRRVH
ncbi:MAG TPA: beta/gamma crystallin-related protein, partial [Rhizomicrobium sp.]